MTRPEVEQARESVGRILRSSYDVYALPEGCFVLAVAGYPLMVQVLDRANLFLEGTTSNLRNLPEGARATVFIWSVSNVGMTPTAALTGYLATEGGSLALGRFDLIEEGEPFIRVSHALLANGIREEPLRIAVDTVAAASTYYGRLIRERFGGDLPEERGFFPSSLPGFVPGAEIAKHLDRLLNPEPPTTVASPATRVAQVVAFLIGMGAVAAGTLFAYQRTTSWAVVAFCVIAGAYTLGRGIPDVPTDPEKVKRALYVACVPAGATAILILVHWLSGGWWLAAVLGLTVGALLGKAVAIMVFQEIAEREQDLRDARSKKKRFHVTYLDRTG